MGIRDDVKQMKTMAGVSDVVQDDSMITASIGGQNFTLTVPDDYPRGTVEVFTESGECLSFEGMSIIEITHLLVDRTTSSQRQQSSMPSGESTEMFEYQTSETLDALTEDMARFEKEHGPKSASRRTLGAAEWISIRFSVTNCVDAPTAKAWGLDDRPIDLTLKFDTGSYIESKRPPLVEVTRGGNVFMFGQQMRNKIAEYLAQRWKQDRFVPLDVRHALPKAPLETLDLPLPELNATQTKMMKQLTNMGYDHAHAAFAASACSTIEEAINFDVQRHVRLMNSSKLEVLDSEALYDPEKDPKKAVPFSTQRGFLCHLVDYIKHRMDSVASYCVICDKPHMFGSGMLQASVCSRDICVFAFQELNVGVDAAETIATEGGVIDLLINIFKAAAISPRADKILNPFPHVIDPTNKQRVILDPKNPNHAKVQELVKSFPTVDVVLGCDSLAHLKARIESKGNKDVVPLLEWVINSNRSFIVKMPKERHLKAVGTHHQFLLITAPPDKQRAFIERKKKYGTKFAWHGSGIENWHAILRGGLRNLSNTELMTSGAAHGSGIYFAPDAGTSLGYCRQASQQVQTGNRIPGLICDKGMVCLALCEIVDNGINDHGWCWTVTDELNVMTRFFFLFEDQSSGQGVSGTSAKDAAFVAEVRQAMAFYNVQ